MEQNRRFKILSFIIVLLAVNVFFVFPTLSAGAEGSNILLIMDGNMGPAGRHGVNKVRTALQA